MTFTKHKAVIFDRDGTLASVAHVRPDHRWDNPDCELNQGEYEGFPQLAEGYMANFPRWKDVCRCIDWDAFNASIPFDAVVPSVAAVLSLVAAAPDVTAIMTSGRDGAFRRQMEWWLRKNDLPIDVLYMRKPGDPRKDSIVKEEIYYRYIEPVFDVILVIDDRPQVCDAWRAIGLPLIQVTDPGILPPIATQV